MGWPDWRAVWRRVVRWRESQPLLPLGQRGEALAAQHLRRQGWRVVARGVRIGGGELDIVGVERQTVVFVEVKTRRREPPGECLAEAITVEKQRRLTRAALTFLRRERLLDCAARFDVITILWPPGGKPVLRHYRDAFEAADLGDSLF